MSEALLEVDNVVRTFGGGSLLRRRRVRAVDGVSFRLEGGRPEIFTIVGESGSGKTTLARMILNMIRPSGGTIRFRGGDLAAIRGTAARLAFMRQVQPVFQNPFEAFNPLKRLDRYLIATAQRMADVSGEADILAAVERALQSVGLSLAEVRGRFPHELSGGQLQRVAIGRAVVRSARLYLFDEPLSNLDAQLRDEMRGEIKRLHQELGKTMIYVTHDQIEAMTMADRIVLLRDGMIEQAGAPLDLFERPATRYVAGFLGSPAMNFVDANLVGVGDTLALRLSNGAKLTLPQRRTANLRNRIDQTVVLGVRPEHIGRATQGERPGLVRYTAVIELLQPTGSRTYATFDLGDTRAVAELQAHEVSTINQQIELSIDMNRVVIIDPATNRVLS